MKALWYRVLETSQGEKKEETVYSFYEARGLLFQVGQAAAAVEPPSWIGPETELPDEIPST